MAAALMSLRDQESGEHDVSYVVACDVDDPVTIGTLQSLSAKLPLTFRVGHRPVSLDALHNQITSDVPGDVYACFIDDALCLTPGWDAKIAEAYAADPRGLWWWTSKGDDLTLMPITSEAWRAAAGGIFPEHFPYWWGDTWLSEVYVLATERNLQFVDAEFLDCPRKTHAMRELRFWHRFYLWLQPERIAQAKRMAAAMGYPEPTITGPLARIIGSPNPKFVARIDEVEADQGEVGKPHEGYRIARARAVAMMGGEEPPAAEPFDIADLLTPEVVAVLNEHFPEAVPMLAAQSNGETHATLPA